MKAVKLDLMPGHCRRLADGETITIKPHMIGTGIPVALHPETHKKLMRAARLNKGMRLTMSPSEIEMSGGKLTWKGFKRGLKKGWDYYKQKIKPVVGPLIRKGLKAAVEKGLPALATAVGAPELAALSPELSKGVDTLGNVSGAYGFKEDVAKLLKKGARAGVKAGKKYYKSTISPALTKELQKGVRKGAKALSKRTSMPVFEEFGEEIATKTVPYLQKKAGLGVRRRKQMFHASMADPMLPAAKPLVDIGNLQYGQDFIKGMGYGLYLAGSGFGGRL